MAQNFVQKTNGLSNNHTITAEAWGTLSAQEPPSFLDFFRDSVENIPDLSAQSQQEAEGKFLEFMRLQILSPE
jgi:hypothetical protein